MARSVDHGTVAPAHPTDTITLTDDDLTSRLGLPPPELASDWRRIGREQLFRLAIRPNTVRREVDRIEFLDRHTLRRQRSIDLVVVELPTDPLLHRHRVHRKRAAKRVAPALLPLMLFEKQPLTNLDVTLSGRAVAPVLNSEQNGSVSAAMLLVLLDAHMRTRGVMTRSTELQRVMDWVAFVPRCRPHEWDRIERDFRTSHGVDGPGRILLESPLITSWLVSLARSFVLTTFAEAMPNERLVAKVSMDIPYASSLRRTAARNVPSRIEIGDAPLGRSHHVEVVAPPGLQILALTSARTASTTRERASVAPTRAHLLIDMPPSPGDLAPKQTDIVIRVWLDGRSSLPATAISAAATTLLLLLALLIAEFREVRVESEVATAILALVPALLIGIVIRPTAHPLDDESTRPYEVSLVWTMFASILGAAGFVVSQDERILRFLLTMSTGIALAATIRLVILSNDRAWYRLAAKLRSLVNTGP